MLFFNSRRQPIHRNGKLISGKTCPCSSDPCKNNKCEFFPEYSSVFHMARAGGFLPYLDVNYVDVEIDGNRKRLPMTHTSYDTFPPGGDTLQLWYNPNSYDNPETSWEEYTAFTVQQIRNGEAQIENLSRLATWAAESRFYLNEDSDSYYLQITAEYDSMPTNWNVTKESAGEYQKLYKNTLDIKFSHWHNGILVNENNTSYTARLYSLNLTQGHALVDPTVIAGVPSFAYTSVNSSYRDRYETDHSGMTFDEIVNLISEPDFLNFRWIGNGLITGMSIYYALAPDCPSGSFISFNFGFDESLKIGYYLPSIEHCNCGDPTLDYITDPIPPDPPIILDFNSTPESSSRSSSKSESSSDHTPSMSGGGSSGDFNSGSVFIPSESGSGSGSGSGESTPSTPSVPSAPSVPSSGDIPSSGDMSGSGGIASGDLYILYASEVTCQYLGDGNYLGMEPGFYLYYTGSTSVWGTYTNPADIPHGDGEIIMENDWGWLFTVHGPADLDTDIPPSPPTIISDCTPFRCDANIYPFLVGENFSAHSHSFSFPEKRTCYVLDFKPPIIRRDNGEEFQPEIFFVDTEEWIEIYPQKGDELEVKAVEYYIEIRGKSGITISPGIIALKFCPINN